MWHHRLDPLIACVPVQFLSQMLKEIPQSSAILTKYTSLRSFHEATNKGSPLDYENAGIYTNSLLDAYMVCGASDPQGHVMI